MGCVYEDDGNHEPVVEVDVFDQPHLDQDTQENEDPDHDKKSNLSHEELDSPRVDTRGGAGREGAADVHLSASVLEE